ncbi:MAG: hypothetical protein PWR21_1319 [Methanoculleus sp.]|nr:hypothetical protein [Methanoculleus sp.]
MFPHNLMNIFAPLMFFLTIAFVLAWPSVLIILIGNLGKEKQRLAISLGIGIIAVASGMIGTDYAGIPASPLISGIILLSMATVSASAVATAYFLFRNFVTSGKKLCIAVGSLIQLPFLFALLVNPDRLPGDPPPLFAEKLPVLGILFDALAEAIGTAGEAGYEGFSSFVLLTGLYLEVFFGAAIICLIVGILMRSLDGEGM